MNKILEFIFKNALIQNNLAFNFNKRIFKINIKYFVADKPARALVLGMQSSNSKYFCPLCLSTTSNEMINSKRHTFFNFKQKISHRTKDAPSEPKLDERSSSFKLLEARARARLDVSKNVKLELGSIMIFLFSSSSKLDPAKNPDK